MDTEQITLEQLTRAIVVAICNHTPDPLIRVGKNNITVQVDGLDQGRMIGRKGVVVWALSHVLTLASQWAHGTPTGFNLVEPRERQNIPMVPFKRNPSWDRNAISDILEVITSSLTGLSYGGWVIESEDETTATINLQCNKQLMEMYAETPEAIGIIMRAIGMNHGVVLSLKPHWR